MGGRNKILPDAPRNMLASTAVMGRARRSFSVKRSEAHARAPMALTSAPVPCWHRSTRPAGLHDAAAADSGSGLMVGTSPRVVTWTEPATRCCLRCGLTPVLEPPSFAPLMAFTAGSKQHFLVDEFFQLHRLETLSATGLGKARLKFSLVLVACCFFVALVA